MVTTRVKPRKSWVDIYASDDDEVDDSDVEASDDDYDEHVNASNKRSRSSTVDPPSKKPRVATVKIPIKATIVSLATDDAALKKKIQADEAKDRCMFSFVLRPH